MLVILTTHPIQYQVPIWQSMAKVGFVPFEVWYLTKHGVNESFDVQFNKSFSWDINLLEGYPHVFLKVNENAAPNKGFLNLRLKESLVPLLKEKGAKAILINGWQVLAYWQAVWQASKAGVQVWLRAETNDLKPINPYKEPLRKILLHQFFNRISYFLFIGQANQRFYLSHGLKKKQLVSGHYCIDNDRFKEQADKIAGERTKIRTGWQIQPNAICLLFSGKLINKKRPLDLVLAARNWKGERPLHLLFMGSGALADELKQACNVVFDEGKKVNKKATSVKASFLGFVNQKELTKGYIAADALVLPSNYGETWGLVVNEAMACGLPAIVSDQVGCAEDLVAPVDPRLVFKCADIESLISAIKDFEKHKDELKNLRLRVLQQVEKYHLRVTVNSIHELYKRIE